MMAPKSGCIGSKPPFNPDEAIKDTDRLEKAIRAISEDHDIDTAIRTYFHIPKEDSYVYHAIASVTLSQVQAMVRHGEKNGLNNWYDGCRDEQGEMLPPPTSVDITAYNLLFSPFSSPSSALRAFTANARKNTIRALVSSHLTSQRFIHPSLPSSLTTIKPLKPKPPSSPSPQIPPNPYLTFLLLLLLLPSLTWCGPSPLPTLTPHKSHPLLPLLMHHFSCACPSHEALTLLTRFASSRAIIDLGSGTGYWTHALRSYSNRVIPIDNGQSLWRAMWISDTIKADGTSWLKRNGGGKDMLLLVVYPIVGGGIAGGKEGGFMREVATAYEGDTMAVVGTQNHNGYTAFRGMTVGEFMEREHPQWVKVVQVPLPSFPGKDEALFIFQKREKVEGAKLGKP